LAFSEPVYHGWAVDNDPPADSPGARELTFADEVVKSLAVQSEFLGKLIHSNKFGLAGCLRESYGSFRARFTTCSLGIRRNLR